jgi:hypothetical protein
MLCYAMLCYEVEASPSGGGELDRRASIRDIVASISSHGSHGLQGGAAGSTGQGCSPGGGKSIDDAAAWRGIMFAENLLAHKPGVSAIEVAQRTLGVDSRSGSLAARTFAQAEQSIARHEHSTQPVCHAVLCYGYRAGGDDQPEPQVAGGGGSGLPRGLPCGARAQVCHAMPCHATPRHAMPCHAMPCHAMPCHAMLSQPPHRNARQP